MRLSRWLKRSEILLLTIVILALSFRLYLWSIKGESRLTDIWYVTKDGAEYFAQFKNPYAEHHFPSLVNGIPFNHTMYVYMPLTFVMNSLAVVFGLDIRAVNLLSEVVILYVLYRRQIVYSVYWAVSPFISILSAAIYVNDFIAIAFLAISLCMLDRGKENCSGFFLGLGLATKQLSALFLVYFLLARKFRPVLLGFVVCALIVMPFFSLDMLYQITYIAVFDPSLRPKFLEHYLLYPLFLLLYLTPFRAVRHLSRRRQAIYGALAALTLALLAAMEEVILTYDKFIVALFFLTLLIPAFLRRRFQGNESLRTASRDEARPKGA